MLKAWSLCSSARKTSNDLTTATVPAGTTFQPCRGNPVISLYSLRGNLLLRPVELGPVDPHAVQNHRELTRDGNLGLAEPVAPGKSYTDFSEMLAHLGITARPRGAQATI